MPLQVGFYRIGITLELVEATRLPAHQAAVLYSLLAEANGRISSGARAVPDGLMLDAPEQCRMQLRAGEPFRFGFTLIAGSALEAAGRVQRLGQGLEQVGREAPGGPRVALGGNFRVQQVEDLVQHAPLKLGDTPMPVPDSVIAEEVERASGSPELTLRFGSPFRFHRSKMTRRTGHAFFDSDVFDPKAFLERLRGRGIRLGIWKSDAPEATGKAELVQNHLIWLDVSYGRRNARKTLGGAVGTVRVRLGGRSDAELAVWGQYFRVGEATRFGFGSYRIDELGPDSYACHRAVSLVETALHPSVVDRLSDQYRLENGRASYLVREVGQGTYRPQMPQRWTIPMGDAERVLAVPCQEDRVLQHAVLEVVSPAFDQFFEASALAFRRGLGRHRAAERLLLSLNQGKTDVFSLEEPFRFLGFQFVCDGDWQSLGGAQPQLLDDLGWYESKSQRDLAGRSIRLPGEVEVASNAESLPEHTIRSTSF